MYIFYFCSSGFQSVKSKRINDNLNPTWENEILRLSWNGIDKLKIKVFDHDNFSKDDPLGDCEIDLNLHINELIELAKTMNKKSYDCILQNATKGSIQFDIEFINLS